jgi:hypothetical protein
MNMIFDLRTLSFGNNVEKKAFPQAVWKVSDHLGKTNGSGIKPLPDEAAGLFLPVAQRHIVEPC